MTQRLSLLLALLLACSTSEGESSAPTPEQKQAEAQNRLVSGLAVQDVAIFQAVKLPIVTAGERVADETTPIVAGRPGVLRVYVQPTEDYTEQSVTAVLSLKQGTKTLEPRTLTKSIAGASSDKDTDSVFDFTLAAEDITSDLSYSITLTGAAQSGDAPASSPARYPADASYEVLGATATSKDLKVVLVPVRYRADSSGRLPETSDEQIETYRNALKTMYPVANVEVSVREPLDWTSPIQGNGAGWDTILNAMIRLRERDQVPSDVYYYGAFSPRASLASFCGAGCVMGLSGLADDASNPILRASVGVGFAGEEAAQTMAHEIGHAHGRPHAPCGGADGPDPAYPRTSTYREGSIGVWGYNVVTNKFIPPTHKDFMGYCQPTWISDFNYKKLFERVVEVNASASARWVGTTAPSGGAFRMASVDGAGNMQWQSSMQLRQAPMGQVKEVEFVRGNVRTTETAHFYPYDHIPGGILMVREPGSGWSSMVFNGHALRVDAADMHRDLQ